MWDSFIIHDSVTEKIARQRKIWKKYRAAERRPGGGIEKMPSLAGIITLLIHPPCSHLISGLFM
jgi:hypothetical protein